MIVAGFVLATRNTAQCLTTCAEFFNKAPGQKQSISNASQKYSGPSDLPQGQDQPYRRRFGNLIRCVTNLVSFSASMISEPAQNLHRFSRSCDHALCIINCYFCKPFDPQKKRVAHCASGHPILRAVRLCMAMLLPATCIAFAILVSQTPVIVVR
jgi:hypothetical protein